MIKQVDFRDDRINVVSLFSGAGGLDLGTESAGLASRIRLTEAMEAFKDKKPIGKLGKIVFFIQFIQMICS